MTAPTLTTSPGAGWVRTHLFKSRRDSVITVVTGLLAVYVLFRIARYLLVTGRWDIVDANLSLYLYGRYPRDDLWRVSATVVLVAFVGGLIAGAIARRAHDAAVEAGEPVVGPSWRTRLPDLLERFWPAIVLVALCLGLTTTIGPSLLVLGSVAAGIVGRVAGRASPTAAGRAYFALPFVLPFALLPWLTGPQGWDGWGGLMLTLLLAAVSMLACFPLGLLLALGRRSTLPAVRALCVGIIEFFRGVPLVVLVLMSDVALGFFFPQDLLPGKVVRVIIAFTIFTAAYVAEIVRGGLQSVPRGQTEAAQALGLSPVRTMGFIVLPQALRNVIPALVGQFISLFKDTTLVFVIGFLDVLSVADAVTKQREFGLDQAPEALAFAALLFWVGSYTLSRESQRLEKRLGVGTR